MGSNKAFDNQIIENLKNRINELQSDQTKNPIKRISNKKEIKKLQKELEQLKAKRSEKYLIIGMTAFGAILALIIAVMAIKENAAGSNSHNDAEHQIVQSVDNMATEDAETVAESDEATETIEVSNTSNLLEEQESEDEIKKKAEEEAAKIAEEEADKKKAEEEAAKKAEEEAARKKAEEEAAAQKAAEEAETQQVEQQTRSQSGGGNGGGSNFNTYDNAEQQNTTEQWVLNTSRKKIHYPSCRDVKKIAPQNYDTSNASLDDLINQGYTRCGHCFK